jgi:hypothetical protein
VAPWLAAGADPVDVARRAGHSFSATVLDRYGHVSDARSELVTDALDAMARGAAKTSNAKVQKLCS